MNTRSNLRGRPVLPGRRFVASCLALCSISIAGLAQADPPALVGRIAYVEGPASFSPAGEQDWTEAPLNRPLVSGDQLWADNKARMELQIGGSAVRMGENTSVTLLDLGDSVAQLQLAQGDLSLRVRRLEPGQVIEVNTPNLAFVIRQPGLYGLNVEPNGESTEVRTSSGRAEVYGTGEPGTGQRYVVAAGTSYRFYGSDLRDVESRPPFQDNDLERWAQQRDRSYDQSPSARYVSRDVIGAQDLDAYGSWRAVPEYGNVWTPTRVSAGWSPYSNGHWAWIDPWGWSWVDDAPWGFAVSHYGRWARIGGSWGWIPGPVAARAVYAPALVAFVGGSNFQISITSGNTGAVGWFPLGPREVYRPAYTVSRGYFTNVNASNTVVNKTQITNIYDQRQITNVTNVRNVTYVNQKVKGAVIAVPASTFVQARPVAPAAVRVSRDAMAGASVNSVAEVAPLQVSVHGPSRKSSKPPAELSERRFIARQAPPAAAVSFAAKASALAERPGKPIDAASLASLKPPAPAAASKVEVVAPLPAAAPAEPPPQRAKGRSGGRGDSTGAEPAAIAPATQAARPEPGGKGEAPKAESAAMAPAAQPVKPQPRGKPEASGIARDVTTATEPKPVAPPAAPDRSTPQAPTSVEPALRGRDVKDAKDAKDSQTARPQSRVPAGKSSRPETNTNRPPRQSRAESGANDSQPGQTVVPAKRASPQSEPVAANKHKPAPSVAPAPVAQAPQKPPVAVEPPAAAPKRERVDKPSSADEPKGTEKNKRNPP